MSCSGRTGNGATLAVEPNDLNPDITNVDLWEIVSMSSIGYELPDLEMSHLQTKHFEQMVCGDLASLNDVELLLSFRPSLATEIPGNPGNEGDPQGQPPVPPEKGRSVKWTITFPFNPTTHSQGAQLEFTGYIKAWNIPTVANNEKMETPTTIKPDGDPDGDGSNAFKWTPAVAV